MYTYTYSMFVSLYVFVYISTIVAKLLGVQSHRILDGDFCLGVEYKIGYNGICI